MKSLSFPASASNIWVNILSLVVFCATIYGGQGWIGRISAGDLVGRALAAAVVPLLLWDYFFQGPQRLSAAGLSASAGKSDRGRLFVKLAGVYATLLVILLFYQFVPMYRDTPKAVEFYAPFFCLLYQFGGVFLVLCGFYFWIVDRQQADPKDEYWQAGNFFLGRWKECQSIVLLEYFKAWFIKAFFLPFMFCFLVGNVQTILFWKVQGYHFPSLFNHCLDILYAVDIFFGVLGYFWALRLFNTHIQSTEPTLLGWWACLACYSPFYAIVGIGLLPSQSEMPWNVWFGFTPVLFYLWGGIILFLTIIYALSTVAFGYRISNLTYRGIITGGPYRYTKHPAYITKVLGWWMISMPIFSTSGFKGALVQTASMLVITFVYYLRARTEENHLSNYPEYVEYANWINEHGLFAFLGRTFPGLRYSSERAARSKSVVWFKKMGS